MNLKDKKLPVIIVGAAAAVIILVLIFMPGKGPDEQGPEVISKRVKIEMPEPSADISASIEPTTAGEPASGVPSTPAPAPVAAPIAPQAPAPVMEAKPAPIEPKAAVKVVPPAPSVKVEAPKAVKSVKPAKKAEKPKKTTVAKKKIAPADALALNIASFTSLTEAQNLAGKLKKGGYNAYIASFTKDSVRWHRVRVGFFASRDEATRAGKTIQAKFSVDKPWIAKPDATELKTHQ